MFAGGLISEWAFWSFWGACGYAVGSVPFGVLSAKIFHLGDLRKIGSGNIGATNVLRTGNPWAALLTLLCDALKGFLPVFLAQSLRPEGSYWGLSSVALVCILGHIFPVWCHFRGGKGLATAAGAFLALDPWAMLAGLVCWLTAFAVTRVSSLAALTSLVGAVGAEVYRFSRGISPLPKLAFSVVLVVLLVWTHRSNIKRLISGTESSFKK